VFVTSCAVGAMFEPHAASAMQLMIMDAPTARRTSRLNNDIPTPN
jgi:hypothetical protein